MTSALSTKRTILPKGTEITLYRSRDDEKKNRNGITFTITSSTRGSVKTNYGSTAICYFALNNENFPGTLKEYYPHDIPIERQSDNSLIYSPHYQNKFETGFKRIENSCIRLNKILSKNKTARNYFTNYTLLYGNNTVYTFLMFDKSGVTFEEYLKSSLTPSNGFINSEIKVINILKCVKNLANIVAMLHEEGYVILDIKPSNFMIIQGSDGNFMTDAVYIIDIDTIIHTDEILEQEFFSDMPFTKHFSSPLQLSPNTDSADAYKELDAYSILSTLYFALTKKYMPLNKTELLNGLENEGYIKSAADLLAEKGFLSALKKLYSNTVCSHFEKNIKKKDFNCKTVSQALSEILGKIEYIEQNYKNLGSAEPLRREKILSEKFSMELMFQNVFYRHPLYCRAFNDSIRLLILGNGELSTTAFKLAFSTGQLLHKKLHIAYIGSSYDEATLAQIMPSLSDFSYFGSNQWIDDETFDSCRYADIVIDTNKVTVEALPELMRKFKANYILCCFEEDKFNRNIAKNIVKLTTACQDECFIGYTQISEDKKRVTGAKMIYPITSLDEINPDLNRMAYNCHYLYSKNSHERDSHLSIRKTFNIPHNYKSNIAAALHVKYKLESLGIRLESCTDAAREFSEKLKDDNENIINKLAYLEHKRWTANNIIAGYKTPRDYNYILRNLKESDSAAKLHPALVTSTPSSIIKPDADWEKIDMQNSDMLDRVSVSLHRFYKEHLEDNDQKIIEAISQLNRCLGGYKEAEDVLSCYLDIINLILNEIRRGAVNYNAEKERFSQELDNLKKIGIIDSANRNHLENIIRKLSSLLFIRIKYLMKTDFKEYDRMFVKRIPFLLKFQSNFLLVENFRKSCMNSKAQYIINAIDFDVKKIIWVDTIKEEFGLHIKTQLLSCINDFKCIKSFFKYRNFKAETTLHLFIQSKKSSAELQALIDECISSLKNWESFTGLKISGSIKFHTAEKLYPEYKNKLIEILAKHKSYQILNSVNDLYDEYGSIDDYEDCRIQKSLSMKEYMALYNAEIIEDNAAGFNIFYKELWKLYANQRYSTNSASEAVWMQLCAIFKNSIRSLDLAVIPDIMKNPPASGPDCQSELTLDSLTAQKLYPVLQELEKIGILKNVLFRFGENRFSSLKEIDTSQNRIAFTVTNASQEQQEKIILSLKKTANQISKEPLSMSVKVEYDFKRRCYKIIGNPLYFEKPQLSCPEHHELFNILCQKGLIVKDEFSDNKKYYSYCSPDMRDILNIEGSVLEIFIYHALKNSGYFTDVTANMKFRWNKYDENSTQNELDVVAVKGTKAIFISAKACKEIDIGMLDQIANISGSYNAIPVLVSGHSRLHASQAVYRRACDYPNLHLICRSKNNQSVTDNTFRNEAELVKLIIDIVENS